MPDDRPLEDFTADQRDRLAAIEVAPSAPESLRERLARAMWETDNSHQFDWEDYEIDHEDFRRMADVAIALMNGAIYDHAYALGRSAVASALDRGTE